MMMRKRRRSKRSMMKMKIMMMKIKKYCQTVTESCIHAIATSG